MFSDQERRWGVALIIANRMQPVRCWGWFLVCLLLAVASADDCMAAATDQFSCGDCLTEQPKLFYNDHCIFCNEAPEAEACSRCLNHVYFNGNCSFCMGQPNPEVCAACPRYFFNTTDQGNQHCSECSMASLTDCDQCAGHTFDWSLGSCVLCADITVQETCSNCTDFYFSETGSCTPCEKATATGCSSCLMFMYQPKKQLCWSCRLPLDSLCICPNHVLSEDKKECHPCLMANQSVCEMCTGFAYDGNNCTNCANTTSSLSCRFCPGYFYDDAKSKCRNCYNATTEETCSACEGFVFVSDEKPRNLFEEGEEEDGFTLGEWGYEVLATNGTDGKNDTNGTNTTNSSGKCLPCSTVTTEAVCKLCPNFAFVNGKTCVECSKADAAGCLSCPFYQYVNDSCLACREAEINQTCLCKGYFFNGSVCLPCGQANAQQCSSCLNRYYFNDSCLQCEKAGPGTCSNCSGYTYANNSCMRCEDTSQEDCYGCSAYGWADVCVNCSRQSLENCSQTHSCLVLGSSCLGCGGLSNATQCLQCEGFAMIDSQCTSCRTAKTSTACKFCSGYFFLQARGSCLPCEEALNNYTCSLCEGYTFSNGTCISCSADAASCSLCPFSGYVNNSCLSCLNSSSSSLCSKCQGFYFSSGMCHHCDHANTPTDCSTCGLPWSNSTNCQPKCTTIANCSICNSTSCQQCVMGFQLYPWGCEESPCNISYCQRCENNDTCALCSDGFELSLNSTQCAVRQCDIAKCRKCANSTACSSCQAGYSLSSEGVSCSLICGVANCGSCSVAGSCSACVANYQLIGGLCSPTCQITNCSVCSSQSTCETCAPGYELSQFASSCVVLCEIDNCYECETSGRCLICDQYYTVAASGQCENSICLIDNCKTCLNETACSACNIGYSLKSGGAVCADSCSIAKCNNCLDAGRCRSCAFGTVLSPAKTACESLCGLDNCVFCLTPSICGICKKGYHTVTTGQCTLDCGVDFCINCTADGLCASCMQGFSLLGGVYCYPVCGWQAMLINSNCVSCSQYSDAFSSCYSCNLQNGEAICSQCLPGYYLFDNACQSCGKIKGCFLCRDGFICEQCQYGYVLTREGYECTALLESCTANCLLCIDATSCLACEWGYTLTGSSCVSSAAKICPSNLILNGSLCVCAEGSYLKGSSCASCSDNCMSCSAIACGDCITGYYLSEGACLECSEHCEDCTTSSSCRQCERRYTVIGGKCIYVGGDSALANSDEGLLSCPAGCDQCTVDKKGNLACLRPQSGSTYDKSGSLTLCASMCESCAIGSPSVCTACYPGFRLTASTCKSCADAKCLTCVVDAKLCTQCGQGYAPNSKGACQPCTANCLSCTVAGPGSCDSSRCQSGYVQALGQTSCLKCLNGCSECDPSDLRKCKTCSARFYQFNNDCRPCIAGCSSCTGDLTCNVCFNNYKLTNAGTCELKPEYPCLDSTGGVCSSCASGFEVAAGDCAVKIACNATSSCSYCPASTYLKGKNCFNCSMPDNCKSCFSNGTGCAQCKRGFYSSGSACLTCPVGCRSCTSASSCSEALSGYFLEQIWGAPSGKVLACSSMCAKCENSAENCISCPANFQQRGSDCLNSQHITLQLVLKPNMAGWDEAKTDARRQQLILGKWPELQAYIQGLAGSKSMAAIHLKGYSFGSLIMDSDISPEPGGNPTDLYANIKNNLASASSASGFQLLTNSIGAAGFTPTEGGESRANLGLILGISVPIFILILLFVIVVNKKVRTQHQMKAIAGNPNLPASNTQLPSADTHTQRQMNKDQIQTL